MNKDHILMSDELQDSLDIDFLDQDSIDNDILELSCVIIDQENNNKFKFSLNSFKITELSLNNIELVLEDEDLGKVFSIENFNSITLLHGDNHFFQEDIFCEDIEVIKEFYIVESEMRLKISFVTVEMK